jgi:copper chaperone CopZ
LSKEKLPELAVRGISSSIPSNLEDGVAENGHVVLSVSGMTCVGCETKLQRSLATIKAVQNLKTSLVLCRAEFDLDRRYETVDSIIHQLQRMTEFKYEELKQDGSAIEVSHPDVKSFIQLDLPTGVLSLRAVDKTTVRIHYNPNIVGARDLVEQEFGIPLSIAPIKPDPSLAAGSKHVRQVGLMTLLSAALTIPVLVLAWAPIHKRPIVYGGVSLAFRNISSICRCGTLLSNGAKELDICEND